MKDSGIEDMDVEDKTKRTLRGVLSECVGKYVSVWFE